MRKLSLLTVLFGLTAFNQAFAGPPCSTQALAGWWYQSADITPRQPGGLEVKLNCMIHWNLNGDADRLDESFCQVLTPNGGLFPHIANGMISGHRTVERTFQGCVVTQSVDAGGSSLSISQLFLNKKGNHLEGFGSSNAAVFSLSADKTAGSKRKR